MARELAWSPPQVLNPTLWAPATEIYLILENDPGVFIATETPVPLAVEQSNLYTTTEAQTTEPD